ncbi:MAG: PSD1 and planctomycete cytochrome C domain-containing protein [Planctomycetaceae bacterium]
MLRSTCWRFADLPLLTICLTSMFFMERMPVVVRAEGPERKVAAEAGKVDFSSQVEPLLAQKCGKCHGDREPEGGLRLTSREEALKRNDSGEPGVVPGDRQLSELYRRITAKAESSERMPPEGDLLTKAEQDLIGRWIDEGAKWPAVQRERHWAYLSPVRPEVPKIDMLPIGEFPQLRQEWMQSPIDSFVLSKMFEHGLKPSPAAEPARLLRRVHLDLVGLPPTLAEIDAFTADPSDEHYVQIVDQLLASPRYGEKWARSWLDLARYADSNGFQADQFREMWAYRDWVIQSMNDDKPFTDFTIEQLAGDLLPQATPEQRIATGFHRCTTCNVEAGVDPEENRVNQIIDRVNTTGTVWLGTTLECAQCHNHKYDPFSQQDYYQLFAYFNNTPLEVTGNGGVQFEVAGPEMSLPLTTAQKAESERLQQLIAKLESQQQATRDHLAMQLPSLIANLRDSLSQASTWHVVPVSSFVSSGGATGTTLEDGSLLVSGKKPETDLYTLHLKTSLTKVTGIRIECLTHESLPGKGPGRGDEKRPNFVLHEFTVEARPLENGTDAPDCDNDNVNQSVPFASVSLHSPQADFEQQNYKVEGLIDGKPETAWAINPQFSKDHWASFLTKVPLGFETGTELRISLPQNFGGARTIGRLRISLLTGPPPSNAKDRTPAIPDKVRALVEQKAAKYNPQQQQVLVDFFASRNAEFTSQSLEISKAEKLLKEIKAPTTLVMVEMEQPRMTSIFKRGNFLSPLATVAPSVPKALHPLATAELSRNDAPANRLTLARWLVDRENPLVARVAVNRWWAEFFGQGLVKTAEDFGTQGERPTHPELLDWLAVEFMERGWSQKEMHRLIVSSATYRQSSNVTPQHLEQDPNNVWLARGPRVRMSAESIRDNALAVSGLLTHKLGGPPVYPPQPDNVWRHVGRNAPKYVANTDEDRYRRGIYVVYRRSAPYPSFVNFDAPDRGACVVQRSRSNTPLQALTLLNDPAYIEMAHALAGRILRETPIVKEEFNQTRARLRHGFRLVLSREPSEREAERLRSFYDRSLSLMQQDDRKLEELIPKNNRVENISLAEQAAWFSIANLLLNLDETITRN